MDDPLVMVRGILWAALFSGVLWCLLALAVWLVTQVVA